MLIEKNTDLSIDGSTLLGGYKVLGYSTTKPYFNFYYPVKNITGQKVIVSDAEAVIYNNYQTSISY